MPRRNAEPPVQRPRRRQFAGSFPELSLRIVDANEEPPAGSRRVVGQPPAVEATHQAGKVHHVAGPMDGPVEPDDRPRPLGCGGRLLVIEAHMGSWADIPPRGRAARRPTGSDTRAGRGPRPRSRRRPPRCGAGEPAGNRDCGGGPRCPGRRTRPPAAPPRARGCKVPLHRISPPRRDRHRGRRNLAGDGWSAASGPLS